MQITRFSANNYKSIRSVQDVELTSGFNIVTGQNAAGKTALLELLGLHFLDKPYRSLETVRNRGDATDSQSLISVQLEVSNKELTRILRNNRQERHLVLPAPSSPVYSELEISQWNGESIRKFLGWFLSQPHYDVTLAFAGGGPRMAAGRQAALDSYAPSLTSNGDPHMITFTMELSGELSGISGAWIDGTKQPVRDFGLNIAPQLKEFVYRFSSERTVQARSPHGTNSQLHPSGRNLPEALNILQGNAALFEDYVGLVAEVLPQVKWLSVRAVPEGHEIAVWSHGRQTTRDDLAVPLDETGSGVAQVLAILYVVVTSYESKTIIIDEPQSFLHPASGVKLVEILKRYPQHQFLLATHSPSIIAAAKPTNILNLCYGQETKLEVFGLHKATSFNSFLSSAGLHLQDVFGADRILWVEGPTEQQAFPEIIDILTDIQLMGTAIVPVRATGDLEGRDAKRIFEMYRTLTRGNALLPPVLAFILDPETRDEQERKELIEQSARTARFLSRRMFENYLLNPEAIAAVMNSIEGFRAYPVRSEDVARHLEESRSNKKYFSPVPLSGNWLEAINASKVLEDVFAELSEKRVAYRKPDHSVQLTRWLLANAPGDLKDIAEILRQAFAHPPKHGPSQIST